MIKIGIIGCGISGLSTGKSLIENNVTNIHIFEKQKTPGGRIQAVKVENNKSSSSVVQEFTEVDYFADTVDIGGQYFPENNKDIIELAQQYNIKLIENSPRRTIIDDNMSKFIYPGTDDGIFQKLYHTARLIIKFPISSIILGVKRISAHKKLNRFYQLYEENQYDELSKEFNQFIEISSTEYLKQIGVRANFITSYLNPLLRSLYMTNVGDQAALITLLAIGAYKYKINTINGSNARLINNLQNDVTNNRNVHFHNFQVDEITKKKDGSNIQYEIRRNQEPFQKVTNDALYVATSFFDAVKIKYIGFSPEEMEYIELMKKIEYRNSYKHIIQGKLKDKYNKMLEKSRSLHTIYNEDIYMIEQLKTENYNKGTLYIISSISNNPAMEEYFEYSEITFSKFWEGAYPVNSPENLQRIFVLMSREKALRENGFLQNIYIGSDSPISSIYTSMLQANKFINEILKSQ